MTHRINSTTTIDEAGRKVVTWSFARHADADPAWHEGEVTPQVIPADEDLDVDRWRIAAGMNYRFEMNELLDAEGYEPVTYFSGYDDSEDARATRFGRPVRVYDDGRRVPCGRPVTIEGDTPAAAYEPTDPAQMFEEMAALVTVARASGCDARIEAAGETRLGNRMFVTVRFPKLILPTEMGEEVEWYMNRLSSIDASIRNTAVASAIRTVCSNTEQMNLWLVQALRGKKREVKEWTWSTDHKGVGAVSLYHRKGHNETMKAALAAFAASQSYGQAFLTTVENLAQLRISDKAFWRIVDATWEKPEQADPDKPNGMTRRSIASWEDRRQLIAQQWTIEKAERGGPTAWNALQPFTHVLSNRTAQGNAELSFVDRLEMRVMPSKGTVGGTAETVIDRVLDRIISSSTRTPVAAV